MKFDSIAFFHDLTQKNKLAVDNKFLPCTCSGIGSLEDVISNFNESCNFIAVDDTNDGQLFGNSGGFNMQETYTVFILSKYTFNDMTDRQAKLDICRSIFRQFVTKLLILQRSYNENVTYLDLSRIFYRELGQYFLSGLTGLYFMIGNTEPTNLIYDKDQWAD